MKREAAEEGVKREAQDEMRRAREALDVKCSNLETNDASRVTSYASRPQHDSVPAQEVRE